MMIMIAIGISQAPGVLKHVCVRFYGKDAKTTHMYS